METTATHGLDTVIGSGTACVLPSIGNPTLPHCGLLIDRMGGDKGLSEKR